jgi:hypothetical protein
LGASRLCQRYSSKVQQRGHSSAIPGVSRCFSRLLNTRWRHPRWWFGTKRPQVQILSPRPVSFQVIAAGQRPCPLEGGAFALPRTAMVLIAGTPPTFAALRWSASSWRSHRSPSSLPRLHGEDLRQALYAGCADDGVLRRIFLAVGVAVVGVVDDQTAVGFDVGDDASRRPTRERLPTPRIPNRWPVCSARGKRAGLCACSSTALGFGECD